MVNPLTHHPRILKNVDVYLDVNRTLVFQMNLFHTPLNVKPILNSLSLNLMGKRTLWIFWSFLYLFTKNSVTDNLFFFLQLGTLYPLFNTLGILMRLNVRPFKSPDIPSVHGFIQDHQRDSILLSQSTLSDLNPLVSIPLLG